MTPKEITQAAFFDELEKIAESKPKQIEEDSPGSKWSPLRAILVGAAGGAAGYGLSELAARNLKFLQSPSPQGLRTAKIILPILSGSAVMIADRYRQKMNDEYSKTKGFRDPTKR